MSEQQGQPTVPRSALHATEARVLRYSKAAAKMADCLRRIQAAGGVPEDLQRRVDELLRQSESL
jgi:hypothetical protein